MKIVSETQPEQKFIKWCDFLEQPPYPKELTEQDKIECTVTLFGSLLDGRYEL